MKKYFLFATVFLFFAFLMGLDSCKKNTAPLLQTALGTVCSVNAFDDGTEKLYGEIFSLLQKIESEFSVHIESSDVSRVNAMAGIEAVPVCDDVFFVLKKALRYAEISEGDFDPTVGPLVSAWGIDTDHAQVPPQAELDVLVTLVNWRNVRLDENAHGKKTAFLTKPGMALDLGGIAKGFAADKVVELLAQKKVRCAMVNLGGNVYAYGTKKDGTPWRVGIKNPWEPEENPALVVSLNGPGTVVTSGSYERFFEQDGKLFHHIINPHTGYPAQSPVLGATIVASSSCDADALSTIAFIQGHKNFSITLKKLADEGLLAETPGAVFIEKNMAVYANEKMLEKLSVHDERFAPIHAVR